MSEMTRAQKEILQELNHKLDIFMLKYGTGGHTALYAAMGAIVGPYVPAGLMMKQFLNDTAEVMAIIIRDRFERSKR